MTPDIDAKVRALRDALDRDFPTIHPRQASRANTTLPANSLGDHEAAIGHAKWVLCSITQSLTDKCPTSAAAEMKWLDSFLAANDIRIVVEGRQVRQTRPGMEFFDPISAH